MLAPRPTILLFATLVLSSCSRARPTAERDEGEPPPELRAPPELTPRELDQGAAEHAPEPGARLTVDVPGDRPLHVVVGPSSVTRPIVYLHGMCADPTEDLDAWGGVAEEHGTIVALEGAVPCPGRPGRTQWTLDVEALDARVLAALRAASAELTRALDPGDVIVIGESMGAARASALAREFPERYGRLVLVGSPETPSPTALAGAFAVASLAGEREPQERMRTGAERLARAGTPARFWELPGATHGHYGPDGERIVGEAVAFVASGDQTSRESTTSAAPTPTTNAAERRPLTPAM